MTKIPPNKLPMFTRITSKVMNSKVGKYLANPKAAGAAVTIATISNITKDGVNCVYYVTQSLNNERIPEDQRKFVAGLDLANGILNVSLQAMCGKAIGKAAEDYFDQKIATKHFTEDSYKKMFKDLNSKIKYDDFKGIMEKNKSFARTGLSVIAAQIGMQVVIKRIIVPLFATPMASIFKEQFEKNEQKKKALENKFEDKLELQKDND